VGLEPPAEFRVLEPRPGQHRHEAPAVPVEMIHLLARAELGVRDVEEVRPPGHRAQRLPRLPMGLDVGRVAVGAAELHGDAAVGAHRENEQQLLEVGAMVLGVAIGDPRDRAPPQPAARSGSPVLPAEADRRRVVVQLREAHAEALADRHDDLREERRAIGIEEPVQGPPELIVPDAELRVRAEAVQAGRERADRLALPVDGLPLHHDGPQQDPQPLGVRHGHPAVVGGDVPGQDRREVQARQEVVDQGERSQPLRAEREAGPGRRLLRAAHSVAILSARSGEMSSLP